MLQSLDIPEWKWNNTSMDCVRQRKNDSIWVIVDRFMKSAHLLPIRTTYDVNPHKIGDNNSSSKIGFEDLGRLQIRNSNFESMSLIFSL
jgi:hypothetical protein